MNHEIGQTVKVITELMVEKSIGFHLSSDSVHWFSPKVSASSGVYEICFWIFYNFNLNIQFWTESIKFLS